MRERLAPVRYRARLDLRARWRTLVLLSLLVGAVAGAVVACPAAARRTDSAFERLRHTTRAADLYVSSTCPSARCAPGVGVVEGGQLEDLAGVRSAVPLWLGSGRFELEDGRLLEYGPVTVNAVTLIASRDPRFGTEVDDTVLVTGRRVAPGAMFEVVVDKELASSARVDVGDLIDVRMARPFDDEEGIAARASAPDFTLEVVGIVLSPLGVRSPTAEYSVAALFAGSELARRFAPLGETGFAISLDPGADGTVIERTPYAGLGVVDIDAKSASIDTGTESETLMLVVICFLGGVGALLVLAPVVARAATNAQRDAQRLRVLGFTRRDLVVRAMLHGVALGAVSAAVAGVVAAALSPIAPVAEARRFEPDRGVDLDLVVIGAGCGLIAAFAAAVVVFSVWRSTRPRRPAPRHSSVVGRLLGSRRVGPIGSLGLRMGFGSDSSGSNAGYFVAMTLGAAVVIAALTFSSAVSRLETTPRLVGMNFDLLTLGPDGSDESDLSLAQWAAVEVEELLDREEVALASAGTFYPPASITLGDEAVESWVVTFQSGPRAVEPVVISGRAPATAHELLVHPALLRRLGEIGDTIPVSADIELSVGADVGTGLAHVSEEFTIVGTGMSIVASQVKVSSAMTFDGMQRLFGEDYADETAPQLVWATFSDDVDHDDAIAGLERDGLLDGLTVTATDGDAVETENRVALSPARDLAYLDLEGLARVPNALALFLGSLAVCVLATMITDKTRTWRARLAIHRALGETSWQVGSGVVTAAIVMTLGAVLVALPIGILAGREVWLRHADRLGVVPEALVPWANVGLVVLGAVGAAVLVALGPAWTSGRRRASVGLRAE